MEHIASGLTITSKLPPFLLFSSRLTRYCILPYCSSFVHSCWVWPDGSVGSGKAQELPQRVQGLPSSQSYFAIPPLDLGLNSILLILHFLLSDCFGNNLLSSLTSIMERVGGRSGLSISLCMLNSRARIVGINHTLNTIMTLFLSN